MKTNAKIYGNLFTGRQVTPARLRNFAQEVLTRLKTMENTPLYNSYFSQLTSATEQLGTVLTEIDSTINHRKNKTADRKLFIKQFKVTMREKQGVIADVLGGFTSEGFAAFYPNGLTEYGSATIAKMPLLVERVNKEAVAYADKLGNDLATLLQSFKPGWHEAFDSIGALNKTIMDKRAARKLAKTALENNLTDFIRVVGQSAGGEEEYKSFFNFNLLYPPVTDKKKATPVVEMPAEQKPAVNQ